MLNMGNCLTPFLQYNTSADVNFNSLKYLLLYIIALILFLS